MKESDEKHIRDFADWVISRAYSSLLFGEYIDINDVSSLVVCAYYLGKSDGEKVKQHTEKEYEIHFNDKELHRLLMEGANESS